MDDGSWHHLSLLCGSSLEDSLLSRNIYIISLWLKYHVGEWAKKSIKTDGQNHHNTKQKGRPKKGQKMCNPAGTKDGRELVPLLAGRNLTHRPINVIHMQTLRSNSNRSLEQAFPVNAIFLSIVVSHLSTHPFKYAFFGKKFKVQDLLV